MQENNKAKWYVLRTMPQNEKRVSSYLKKIRIKYYLPLVSKKRRWSDRFKIIDIPLFPGYIFTYFDWLEGFNQVVPHPGVIDFICKGKQPASMSTAEMVNLERMIIQAKEIYADPDKNFPAGQEVIVRSGSLKGVHGVVARVKNQQRIFIRLHLLDRVISAELDIVDVEKV